MRAPNSLYFPISLSKGNRKVVSPNVWLTGGFGDRRTLASSWEPVFPLSRQNRKVAYLHEHWVSLLNDILSHTNKPYIQARTLSHHGAGYKSARCQVVFNTSWRSFQAWKGLSWGDICCSWARWVDCWKQASSCSFQGRELSSQMHNTWHLCAQRESTQIERQLHEKHVQGCVHMQEWGPCLQVQAETLGLFSTDSRGGDTMKLAWGSFLDPQAGGPDPVAAPSSYI